MLTDTNFLPQVDSKKHNTQSNVTVVCAADNHYAMQLAVVLRSVLENLSKTRVLDAYIIDGGIDGNNKQKISQTLAAENCRITWLEVPDKAFADLKVNGHISTATYYRLLIPELLPDLDKVIYLDSDLIVNVDISSLWDTDISDNCLAAVVDQDLRNIKSAIVGYESLDLSGEEAYFNAGVLLMNLSIWRQEKLADRIVKFMKQYPEYIELNDQDGLNIILAAKWKALDHRWNRTMVFHSCNSWEDSPFDETTFVGLEENPFIIHCTTKFKPWNAYNHPDKKLFYKYVDMTAWRGWRFTFWDAVIQKIKSRKLI
jgi:lipopolysaccharide biosynthesis glycosyltransferase